MAGAPSLPVRRIVAPAVLALAEPVPDAGRPESARARTPHPLDTSASQTAGRSAPAPPPRAARPGTGSPCRPPHDHWLAAARGSRGPEPAGSPPGADLSLPRSASCPDGDPVPTNPGKPPAVQRRPPEPESREGQTRIARGSSHTSPSDIIRPVGLYDVTITASLPDLRPEKASLLQNQSRMAGSLPNLRSALPAAPRRDDNPTWPSREAIAPLAPLAAPKKGVYRNPPLGTGA